MSTFIGHEFKLGKNAILVLVVIQLTALLFGIMTLTPLTNGVNCRPNQLGSDAICKLNLQLAGINDSVHQITGAFACTGNPTLSTCALTVPPGNGNPFTLVAQAGNLLIGIGIAIGSFFFLLSQLLFLIVFILLIFFPSLFSQGALGAFGALFGILLDGASLIMLFYALSIIVNRLPWVGKHG